MTDMNYRTVALSRPTVFALFYLALVLVEYQITRSLAFKQHSNLLVGAVLIDLVVLPEIAFYWLIIKPLNRPKALLGLVLFTFIKLALFILPAGSRPFNVSWSALVPFIEACTLIIVLVRFRFWLRVYRTLRFVENSADALQGSLTTVFGSKATKIILGEGQVIRFSLLSWYQLKKDITIQQQAVTTYKESGQTALMVGLLLVCGIEITVLHLLIAHWYPAVAHLVTAASIYSLLFLISDLVTTHVRPSFLTPTTFHLRLGMRWHAVILRSNIARVEPLTDKPTKEPALLNGMLLTAPNTLLTLHEPVWIEGAYGIRKEIQKIALFVDDKRSFSSAMIASGCQVN